jgi:hypothetical protein
LLQKLLLGLTRAMDRSRLMIGWSGLFHDSVQFVLHRFIIFELSKTMVSSFRNDYVALASSCGSSCPRVIAKSHFRGPKDGLMRKGMENRNEVLRFGVSR